MTTFNCSGYYERNDRLQENARNYDVRNAWIVT